MEKIGRKIGILTVNWEDLRAWKTGNCSNIVKDKPEFIVKGESSMESRVIYAASMIV